MRFGRDLQPPKLTLPQLRLADALQHLCHIHARAPGTLGFEPHQLRHMLTISRDHAAGEIAAGTLRHHSAARIDGDAGGEALEVPFERRRQRLVEIGDVENGCAVRCRIDAEIRQMAVAAGLHPDAAGRRGRKIRRHHHSRTAQEGERRLLHAAIADRQQRRDPMPAGLDQHVHRITPVGRRLPGRVQDCAAPTDEGHGLPHVAPPSGADRRVGHSRVACSSPDFVTITPQSGMPAQAEFVI